MVSKSFALTARRTPKGNSSSVLSEVVFSICSAFSGAESDLVFEVQPKVKVTNTSKSVCLILNPFEGVRDWIAYLRVSE